MTAMNEIIKEYSIRNAQKILKKRGALEACRALAMQVQGDPSKNKKLKTKLGFGDQVTINVGDNEPQLDAYSKTWRVGVEREYREQMNVRSHLLFTEIAYKIGKIDVGVYISPIENNGKAEFGRTRREISEYKIFNEYFPLTVPLYLIGCK